jgi:hypothetical protein
MAMKKGWAFQLLIAYGQHALFVAVVVAAGVAYLSSNERDRASFSDSNQQFSTQRGIPVGRVGVSFLGAFQEKNFG